MSERPLLSPQDVLVPEATVEIATAGPEIISYFDVISPEQLLEQSLDAIWQAEPQSKRYMIRNLGFEDPETVTESEIRDSLTARIENYEQKLVELKEFVPKQLKNIYNWINRNTINITQQPEEIPLYLFDKHLHPGSGLTMPGDSRFDPVHNTIGMDVDHDFGYILAHEYAHAMAFDKEDRRTGFIHSLDNQTLDEARTNKWLDEGCAILFEAEVTISTDYPGRDTDDLYGGYLWLTQQFIRELDISTQDLLRAYFTDGSERETLNQRAIERWGCTIYDLSHLFIGYNEKSYEQMSNMLQGNPTTLTAWEGSGVDKELLKLKEIFPQIEVIITPRHSKSTNGS